MIRDNSAAGTAAGARGDAAGRARCGSPVGFRLRCVLDRALLFGLCLLPAALWADVLDDQGLDPAQYAVEIYKSRQMLIVKKGDAVERLYHVAWGRGGPGGKQRIGDNKTPTGVYRIVGFNDSSKFYLFMRLNYPNVKDAFFGLKNNLISRAEFDRIMAAVSDGALPPQNTPLGGAIGIHGLGDENKKKLAIHQNMNWTEGCIALTNVEVDQLRSFVNIGTRVVIRE